MKNKLTPETNIHDADFSVRTLNVIKRANGNNDWWNKGRTVETLKDLSGYSEEEIFRLKGSGEKVFSEIKSVINESGLTLSEKSNRGDWNVYGFNKLKRFKSVVYKK